MSKVTPRPSRPLEVLVVQHGDKIRAPGDPGLTDMGLAQASDVARLLVAHEDVSAVWSSPLLRARETARRIADPFGLIAQVDEGFRERMNWDDKHASIAEFLTEWDQATNDRAFRPTHGDSSEAAAARFLRAVWRVSDNAGTGAVVVVTHGGVTIVRSEPCWETMHWKQDSLA